MLKSHNRLFLIFSLVFLSYGIGTMLAPKQSPVSPKRKKVIIFSCEAGMAHKHTAARITELLKDTYEVKTVDFLSEIFTPLDPFQYITSTFPFRFFFREPLTAQDIYNFLLQKRWLFVANNLLKAGNRQMRKNDQIEKVVCEYLKHEKPDLAISVIPVMNHGILRAARRFNIPFLLQTLDLNPTYWANGITTEDCSYKHFIYAIPFNDGHLKKATLKRKIAKKKMVVSGYPLQNGFFQKYDVAALRKKYNIPPTKKVVMIMMGGVGSAAITTFARRIMRMNLPIHLFICLGKSAHLLPEIKQLKTSPSVTYTLFTYTNEIPQLMAASDIILTKAGANTVAEALQMKLPMLLDRTAIFALERKNLDFITKHQFGEAVKSYRDIEKLLKKYLGNERLLNRIKNNLQSFQPKKFNEVLPALIESMLEKRANELQFVSSTSDSNS